MSLNKNFQGKNATRKMMDRVLDCVHAVVIFTFLVVLLLVLVEKVDLNLNNARIIVASILILVTITAPSLPNYLRFLRKEDLLNPKETFWLNFAAGILSGLLVFIYLTMGKWED